jgi:hypothetical protein
MLFRGSKLFIAGTILLGTGGLVFSALSQAPITGERNGPYNSVGIRANSNGILNQCTDTFIFGVSEGDYGTIPADYTEDPTTARASMIVPVYGYMSPEPFDFSKYTPYDREKITYSEPEILRALWENNHVIWVNSTIEQAGYDYIVSYAEEWNKTHEDKILVQAWFYTTEIPVGKSISFSSWGASQSCATFSEETFQLFLKNTESRDVERDYFNPPAAPLNDMGLLEPIKSQ